MSTEWSVFLANAGVIIATLGFLWKIRTNDLHDIGERLQRIEDKLDKHVEWHLGGR